MIFIFLFEFLIVLNKFWDDLMLLIGFVLLWRINSGQLMDFNVFLSFIMVFMKVMYYLNKL